MRREELKKSQRGRGLRSGDDRARARRRSPRGRARAASSRGAGRRREEGNRARTRAWYSSTLPVVVAMAPDVSVDERSLSTFASCIVDPPFPRTLCDIVLASRSLICVAATPRVLVESKSIMLARRARATGTSRGAVAKRRYAIPRTGVRR